VSIVKYKSLFVKAGEKNVYVLFFRILIVIIERFWNFIEALKTTHE